MATKLEKNLVRESTLMVDGKEILITITAEQTISLKLKGLRGHNGVSIGIAELWYKLNGTEPDTQPVKKSGAVNVSSTTSKPSKNDPMISLYDIRTNNSISTLPYPVICQFESILKNLIDNYPEKYGKYKKP